VLVALLIQHVSHMSDVVTSFVAPSAPPYFSPLSHKRHDFLTIFIEHKICFDFNYKFSRSKKNSVRDRQKYRNVFM
jgi:hypothetical protein